jgi:DNA polymerase III delta prime subunit
MPLSKFSLISICQMFNINYKKTNKIYELLEKISNKLDETSQKEIFSIFSQIEKEFKSKDKYKLSIEKLREQCLNRKIDFTTTDSKLDLVARLEDYSVIELDKYQKETLDKIDQKLLLISAGPGSGKTTTLSFVVRECAKKNNKILISAFNRNAEERMRKLLKRLNLNILPKSKDPFSYNSYITCLTFHKIAARIVGELELNEYDKLIRNATIKLKKGNNQSTTEDFNFSNYSEFLIDVLVIDEAQDISDELAEFVNALRARSRIVIIAGDPRQEIVEGASYFTNLWSETDPKYKHELKYNYRSNLAIVELLNRFSFNNFQSSHHNQIADSEQKVTGNEIKFINTEEPAFSIYDAILKTKRKTIIITPVSIEKYNHERVLKTVNELLFRSGSLKRIRMIKGNDSLYDEDDINTIIATSVLKVKGSEVDHVILLSPELNYSLYGAIEDRIGKRRLYVSLSRAISKLTIIYNNVENEYFASICPDLEKKVYDKISDNNKTYATTEITGIIRANDIDFNLENRILFDKINIGFPTAILGLFIEYKIAEKMKLLDDDLNFIKSPKFVEDSSPFYDKTVLHLKKNEKFALPYVGTSNLNIFTLLTLIREAASTGEWSYHLIEEIEKEINKIDMNLLDSKLSEFCEKYKFKLYQIPRRDEVTDILGKYFQKIYISSLFDFVDFDDNIIEIKYANESKDHLYQIGMYCHLTGLNGKLINLYEGFEDTIESDCLKNNRYFDNITLPQQTLRINHYLRKIKALNTRYKKVKCPIKLDGKMIISVDLESLNSINKNCTVTQIGASIVYASGNVIDNFLLSSKHLIVRENNYPTSNASYFENENENIRLRRSFNEWLRKYRENNIISLSWYCDDFGAVKDESIKNLETISVDKIYKEWLEINKMSRKKNTKLEDCLIDTLGEITSFSAHNAYEDSIISLFCFFAMCDLSGCSD